MSAKSEEYEELSKDHLHGTTADLHEKLPGANIMIHEDQLEEDISQEPGLVIVDNSLYHWVQPK